MAHGPITKWRDLVFSHGQTVEDMKVNTLTTKKRVREHFIGQTGENMMAAGKMANSMVLDSTLLQVVKASKANGKMERDFIGYKINETIFTLIIGL